jgi:C-terminal binding protein
LVVILDSRHGGYVPDTSIEMEMLDSLAAVELLQVERAAEAAAHLRNADVLISWHHIALERSDLETMRRCRGIVRASVGFENIALDAATEFGIPVCNVPDYGTEEVADHTLMLLLAITRNILGVTESTRRGEWRWQAAGEVPRLRGRRLGIVGLGRIGAAVARRAIGFDLTVTCFDPYAPSGLEKALGIARVESLQELLRHSDVLTLHAPLTPETRGLIGRDELALLPADAIVLNTARGEILDQRALIEAISAGRVVGAGLDVLASEPSVPRELRDDDRVLLSAHSAFYSRESLTELRVKSARAAQRFLQEPPGPRVAHRDDIVAVRTQRIERPVVNGTAGG